MFRKLLKNKKAQNVAEYALLIALVVGAVIAMQTYMQRSYQARMRDAASYAATVGDSMLNSSQQYEPYYLSTDFTTNRQSLETKFLSNQTAAVYGNDVINRTGSQVSTYDNTIFGESFDTVPGGNGGSQ